MLRSCRRARLSRALRRARFAGLFLAATSVPFTAEPSFAASRKVDIELVLAVDTSVSVSETEYALQMLGIAAALRHPEISAIIQAHENGVAVAVVHWSYGPKIHLAIPWAHLTDRRSLEAFAATAANTARNSAGRSTSIGGAIDFSVKAIEENAFAGTYRRIDISGDARSNSGPHPAFARDRAMAKNITINGLAITGGDEGLLDYYTRYVTGGPGSFVIPVNRFADIADSIRQKLKRELILLISDFGDEPTRTASSEDATRSEDAK